MKDFNRTITRENIFLLLHHSGLTDEQFANILGVSIRWFRYIKSGNYDFKIAEIEEAAKFFNTTFNNLTSKKLTPAISLRDDLIATHKNNTEYLKPLLDNPTIPYAIEFKLLNNPEFLDSELEVSAIRSIFEKSGWKFESSSLSNALKGMDRFIKYRKQSDKAGKHRYSKK